MKYQLDINDLMDISDRVHSCEICKSVMDKIQKAVISKEIAPKDNLITIDFNFFTAQENAHLEENHKYDLNNLLPYID